MQQVYKHLNSFQQRLKHNNYPKFISMTSIEINTFAYNLCIQNFKLHLFNLSNPFYKTCCIENNVYKMHVIEQFLATSMGGY